MTALYAFMAVHKIISDICWADPDGPALTALAIRVPWAWDDAVAEGLTPEEVASLALDGAQVCDGGRA